MLQICSKLGLAAIALCGLMLMAGVSQGQDRRVRHVQDDAGLFSQAAKDQANKVIAKISEKHHKDLFIETVTKGPATKEQASAWARDRFNNYKIDGVYVVFSKDPKFFRIEVGNLTREKGYFTNENVRKLEEIIKAKQTNDDMLRRIADYGLDTMNAQAPAKKTGGKAGNAAPAPAPGRPRAADPDASAPSPWLGWICMIVAVLLVVWVVFAIIRAFSGGGASGGSGGGGGGGGGGGFFTGMLGGLFGAMAGMWIYNNFFGGHATQSPSGGVNWGDSGSSDAAGYQGDTDTGASGGGDDWGGGGDAGGGAAGGGDAGGGDWGGGGDAGGGDAGGGGGDWGGGGGDAGGGGDWGGGGGDFGGGGGGDW